MAVAISSRVLNVTRVCGSEESEKVGRGGTTGTFNSEMSVMWTVVGPIENSILSPNYGSDTLRDAETN